MYVWCWSICSDDLAACRHEHLDRGRRDGPTPRLTGLSAIVQVQLEQDPFAGHVFVFRGRRGDLIKVLWWDGDGLCLFAKRLERGRFVWPRAESVRCA